MWTISFVQETKKAYLDLIIVLSWMKRIAFSL